MGLETEFKDTSLLPSYVVLASEFSAISRNSIADDQRLKGFPEGSKGSTFGRGVVWWHQAASSGASSGGGSPLPIRLLPPPHPTLARAGWGMA